MNELEWKNCNDPKKMIQSLKGKVSDRKLRLFACAVFRVRMSRSDKSNQTEAQKKINSNSVTFAERTAEGLPSRRYIRGAGCLVIEIPQAIEAAKEAATDFIGSGIGEITKEEIIELFHHIFGKRE